MPAARIQPRIFVFGMEGEPPIRILSTDFTIERQTILRPGRGGYTEAVGGPGIKIMLDGKELPPKRTRKKRKKGRR